MTDHLLEQLARAGGVETTTARDLVMNERMATYRGWHLRFLGNDGALQVARVLGFDRWANSRVHESDAPTTMEALDALLDGLEGR